MQLLIISNMPHYRRGTMVVGHGATTRELDALASLFTSVRHIACLHDEEAPASALPYQAPNIEMVFVPPAGGPGIVDKLDIVRRAPLYVGTMQRELKTADVVHVRAPANITLYALPLLALARVPRCWIKYAGNWRPMGREPWSYRVQRLWLEHGIAGANVTINGAWPEQPTHVVTFLNPCLTDAEVAEGVERASTKSLTSPTRLLFVGHLGAAKNPRVAIDAAFELSRRGHDVKLDLVGEGIERVAMEAELRPRKPEGLVTFHGPLPRTAIDELYAAAHFVVLPSRTEGWPKVLAEGMAYGAVPIAAAVGSISETLRDAGCGTAIPDITPASFADSIEAYLQSPLRWQLERDRGLVAARRFTYTAYLDAVRSLLQL